jgi:hypothetical protein
MSSARINTIFGRDLAIAVVENKSAGNNNVVKPSLPAILWVLRRIEIIPDPELFLRASPSLFS